MNCEDFQILIDEFEDGELKAHEADVFDNHLRICGRCRGFHQEHLKYLRLLDGFRAPIPRAGVLGRMMRVARQNSEQQQLHRHQRVSFLKGFAAASILALTLFVGLQWSQLLSDKSATTDPLNREILVVIHVPADMPDANLALTLPDVLSLEGFRDLHRLQWDVDLIKGANTLSLPVRVRPGFENHPALTISATVTYNNQHKGFELPVKFLARQAEDAEAALRLPRESKTA
ncbi:hypothetical protein HBA55_03165 [Pseudomaricurvus alkylphenolicus]|uniref:zf-HC2 domain-containing protein n=1 Tax=Pseudomaricurvus alkylphenolicus TaxID=1306991 RepID=UPI0014233D05|nr:zf-HC2 domain-containing protein [Pseudomaricurvus alkylphenolicus]NIB38567.1 hypothetical protein [Pseudomaricurvus alkylphenolicus]